MYGDSTGGNQQGHRIESRLESAETFWQVFQTLFRAFFACKHKLFFFFSLDRDLIKLYPG